MSHAINSPVASTILHQDPRPQGRQTFDDLQQRNVHNERTKTHKSITACHTARHKYRRQKYVPRCGRNTAITKNSSTLVHPVKATSRYPHQNTERPECKRKANNTNSSRRGTEVKKNKKIGTTAPRKPKTDKKTPYRNATAEVHKNAVQASVAPLQHDVCPHDCPGRHTFRQTGRTTGENEPQSETALKR